MKHAAGGVDVMTQDEKVEWLGKDAWTLREFAMLCCGWNPDRNDIPDPSAYNRALADIVAHTKEGDLFVSIANGALALKPEPS